MRHVLCLFLKRRLTQTLQATEGLKPPRLSEESRFLLERPLPPCRRVAERSRSSRSSRSSKKKELTCDTCFIVLWLWLFSEAGPAPDGALNALRAALRKVHGLSSCTAFLRARCAGIFTEYLVASQEQAVVQDGLRVVLDHLEVAALTSFLGQRCWHSHPIISHPSCLQHAPVPEPRYPI